MPEAVNESFEREVSQKNRFEFGANWTAFLTQLDDRKIEISKSDLSTLLKVSDLKGLSLLDAGSGSGLSSLVSRQLGAHVTSFDYDPLSVACTNELRQRYFPNDTAWNVLQGSVLDMEFLQTLGEFDIAMSWGVLHHTGDMWKAMDNIRHLVKPGGMLFIALYNDQGLQSRIWLYVKKFYVRSPRWMKKVILGPAYLVLWGPTTVLDFIKGRPFATWRADRGRGMTPHYDLVDWVGGLPFEVAKREDVVEFYNHHNFELVNMVSVDKGLGCNQFVFRRKVN